MSLQEWLILILLVFLLIGVFLWWYKKTPKAKSETEADEHAYERENRLFRLYQNLEDMMDGFEEYVDEQKDSFSQHQKDILDEVARERGEVARERDAIAREREEITRERAEISKQMEEIAHVKGEVLHMREDVRKASDETGRIYSQMDQMYKMLDTLSERSHEALAHPPVQTEAPARNEPQLSEKALRVRGLYLAGYTQDQIAREMGVARSGVKLILDMLAEAGQIPGE